jgi:hypothetical protein
MKRSWLLLACLLFPGLASAQTVSNPPPKVLSPLAIFCATATSTGSAYIVCPGSSAANPIYTSSGSSVGGLPLITSTAVETSHVFAVIGTTLHQITVNTGVVSGWVQLLDAVSDPGNAITNIWRAQVGANQSIAISFNPPITTTTGAVWVFSTTGPFIETQSATATFSGN